jgi:NADH dehydrogenase
MPDGKRTIVILGAGFAGIAAYSRLRDRMDRATTRIVIVNRANHFLFSPLLHEVATGGLGIQNAVVSIRELIDRDCAEFIQASVTEVDTEQKRLVTDAGPVRYDHLVVATGATTDFLGVRGAAEHARVLKELGDARSLRERLIDLFEDAAARETTGRAEGHLGFVVVGGGPTGVELAAEMADLFHYTFRRFYRRFSAAEHASITLLHSGPRLLPQFHASLGSRALGVLKRAGVRVMLGARVAEVSAEGVALEDGTRIAARTVLWCAGVRAVVPQARPPLPTEASGRIAVDNFFRVRGVTDVWALGDCAAVADGHGASIPMRAQAAVVQGPAAADNILASMAGQPLALFSYRPKGDLVSLGRWQAVGDIAHVRWSGRFAWWLWRTVYLFNFPSWPKRLRIAIDWTVNLFHPRDLTKI